MPCTYFLTTESLSVRQWDQKKLNIGIDPARFRSISYIIPTSNYFELLAANCTRLRYEFESGGQDNWRYTTK